LLAEIVKMYGTFNVDNVNNCNASVFKFYICNRQCAIHFDIKTLLFCREPRQWALKQYHFTTSKGRICTCWTISSIAWGHMEYNCPPRTSTDQTRMLYCTSLSHIHTVMFPVGLINIRVCCSVIHKELSIDCYCRMYIWSHFTLYHYIGPLTTKQKEENISSKVEKNFLELLVFYDNKSFNKRSTCMSSSQFMHDFQDIFSIRHYWSFPSTRWNNVSIYIRNTKNIDLCDLIFVTIVQSRLSS